MNRTRPTGGLRAAAAGPILAVLLAGCGAPGAPTPAMPAGGAPASAASTTATAAPRAVPIVADAWVRPPVGPDRPAGGYLTITGGAIDDALVGATSPIAGSVQLHETTADASGMAAMRHVDRIGILAGATVALEPGGYHLMLMDLTRPLEPGATVELTLTFESAGAMTVEAEIRPG